MKKIIEAGILAPSGENAQPWRFVVRQNQIDIFNLPERDQSLYSWGQRASFVAHGAAIENMRIAAVAFGYASHITLFPDASNENLVATISFSPIRTASNPLYQYISARTTNRKPYKDTPLKQEQLTELHNAVRTIEGGEARIVQDTEKKSRLAQAASVNEMVLFGNKELHNFFFSHVTWTKEEDREKKIGFYIKTLEVPKQALPGFKLSKHWPVAKTFDRAGFSKVIAKQNAKTYASSSAIGAVLIPNIKPESFVTAGRVTERIWLTTTMMGLSLQPLAGLLFLAQRVLNENSNSFSPRHATLIKDAYQQIRAIFDAKDKHVAMMFRIGKGGQPSARSLRLPPIIESHN